MFSILIHLKKIVVLKGMLKSPCLKYHVKTIGIEQPLNNNALCENKCFQNINKLYKHAGKCDDQQQFKYIFVSTIVSTTEGFTNNSPISTMTSTTVNKPIAGKSLCLFTNILDAKKKTATHLVGASKSKHKAIKYGTTLWVLEPK